MPVDPIPTDGPATEDDDLPSLTPGTASAAGPGHVPVLPRQVLEYLAPRPGQVVLDCTTGRAGHAQLVIPHLAPGGRYIGLDVDPENLEYARTALSTAAVPTDLVRANFAAAGAALAALGLARVDLLLADLGFSSNQIDDPRRGLSFNSDAPLDMRLDPDLPQTAADLVNRLPERDLADVIYRYGEEPLSRKIARKVVEARRHSPILTTLGLAQLVQRAYGGRARQSRLDPATRTFMALRIAVNEELQALERLLTQLPGLLQPGGRVVVIGFHSLEDRLVKQAFNGFHRDGLALRLTPKPVVADETERNLNPRSRSAKLRALEWRSPDSTGRGVRDNQCGTEPGLAP